MTTHEAQDNPVPQWGLLAETKLTGTAPVVLDLENVECVTIVAKQGYGMAYPSSIERRD